MKKETIAVDIDDVLVETAPAIIEMMNTTYGMHMGLDDFYSPDPKAWGADTYKEAMRRVNSVVEREEYLRLPPLEEAAVVLSGLKKTYDLAIITARLSVIEESTKHWLAEHFPNLFDHVRFISQFDPNHEQPLFTKAQICQEISARYLIDDNLSHILEASKVGTEGLLFGSYPWNRAETLPANVQRVHSWAEVGHVILGSNVQG